MSESLKVHWRSGASAAPRAEIAAAADALRPLLVSVRFLLLLGAAGCVAAGLAGLDLAYRYAVLDGTQLPGWFDMTEEGGLGESWEYGLTALAALAMGRLWLRSRAPIFAVASLVFGFATIDNGFGLHELGGRLLGPVFASIAGSHLEPKDLGEVATFGLVGAILLGALRTSLRSGERADNARGLAVMGCIGLAAFFGVGVDLLHASLHNTTLLADQIGTFVEEFGEMLSLSLAAALALGIRAPRQQGRFSPG